MVRGNREGNTCLAEEVTPAGRGQGCLPEKLEDLTAFPSPETVSSPPGQADLTWLRCESAPAQLESLRTQHCCRANWLGLPDSSPCGPGHKFGFQVRDGVSPSIPPSSPASCGWQVMLPKPRRQQAATTQNKVLQICASHSPFSRRRHKARAHSLFPLFSHSPHTSPAWFSPIAYPAVSHSFHKNRAHTVPLLHFSSLLSPPDAAAFPCSEEMQRSRVQPWPQLPRTPNFPGSLQLGVNHLPAQPPRETSSL